MHASLHTCTDSYINTYIHSITYIHTYVRTYIHAYTSLDTYTHTCMHAYIHRYTSYVCTYIHTCTHTRIHAYTHTRINTYMHTWWKYTHILRWKRERPILLPVPLPHSIEVYLIDICVAGDVDISSESPWTHVGIWQPLSCWIDLPYVIIRELLAWRHWKEEETCLSMLWRESSDPWYHHPHDEAQALSPSEASLRSTADITTWLSFDGIVFLGPSLPNKPHLRFFPPTFPTSDCASASAGVFPPSPSSCTIFMASFKSSSHSFKLSWPISAGSQPSGSCFDTARQTRLDQGRGFSTVRLLSWSTIIVWAFLAGSWSSDFRVSTRNLPLFFPPGDHTRAFVAVVSKLSEQNVGHIWREPATNTYAYAGQKYIALHNKHDIHMKAHIPNILIISAWLHTVRIHAIQTLNRHIHTYTRTYIMY